MKIGEIYNICGTSFFKEREEHEAALFSAILRCISERSSELFIAENDDFIDVVFRKSGEVAPIFHLPKNFAGKFCDFAATAFPHKELSNFIGELDGFSIINLNGNLVHALFYDYAKTNPDGRICYCVQLVFDESCTPQEAESLIIMCRKEWGFRWHDWHGF